MKRILIMLLPLLWACGGNQSIDKAEALMAEHPDSALMLLNAIPGETLKDEGVRYRVIALKAQAHAKLGNDSIYPDLLDKASGYFLRTGQKHYRLLSEFYTGYHLEDSDDIEAIDRFLTAEELAKELRDSFFLSGVYGHIAYIYNKNKSYKVELEYARKALRYHSPERKDKYYFSDLDYLSGALINNKEYEEAIANSLKLIAEAELVGDKIYEGLGYCSLGYARMGMKDYGGAVDAFENMMRLNPDSLDPTDCRYVGLAYYMNGDRTQAQRYFNMTDSMGDHGYMPYQPDEEEGRLQEALDKLKDELRYTNEVYGRSMNQAVTLSIIRRRESEKALAEMKAGIERKMRTGVSIAAIAALGGGILCFISYRRRRRVREEELTEYARTLLQDMETGQRRYGDLYKAAIEVLRSSMDNINEMAQLMSETNDKGRLNYRLADKVRSQIESFRRNPGKISRLKSSVNSLTGNITDDFARDFPDLTEKDRLLFLYLASGFTSTTICRLLDISHANFYTRKSRLKTRVCLSSAERKEEYMYLLG